ncbi:MAG: hypothetical protein MJZ76_06970 [Bacteroidales bacterium]|nr:hypothetical protein [Bacteroidales bacterium]
MKKSLLFLLFFPALLFAQYDYPLRIEIPTAKDSEDYSFVQLGEKGCFVIYEGNPINKDSVAWLFMHYDTNLLKARNAIVTLPPNVRYVTSCIDGPYLYTLFQTVSQKKQENKSYLARLNTDDYQADYQEIKGLANDGVFQIKVIQEHLIVCAAQKENEDIYFYNLTDQQFSKFYLDQGLIYSIEFLVPDTLSSPNKWLIGLIQKVNKDSYISLFKTTLDGKIIQELDFPDLNNGLYTSARCVCTDTNDFLIIGTYDLIQKNANSTLNSGCYTMLFNDTTFSIPQCYPYAQINEANVNKSSKNNNGNLQFIVSDITSDGTQYALTTELFYPEYSYSDGGYYDFYHNYIPSPPTFLGYRYINAYITTFDCKGVLSWSHFLPFGDLLTQRLINRVSLFFDKENTLIYYPYNYTLTSMYVHQNDIIEPLSRIKLETNHPKDEIEYTKFLKMEKWYDNNFIVSGYQYIKSGIKGSKSKKYVFFANKLKYY